MYGKASRFVWVFGGFLGVGNQFPGISHVPSRRTYNALLSARCADRMLSGGTLGLPLPPFFLFFFFCNPMLRPIFIYLFPVLRTYIELGSFFDPDIGVVITPDMDSSPYS